MSPRTSSALLFAAWLAWVGVVLSHYYEEAFRNAAGPRSPSRAGVAGAAILMLAAAGAVLLKRTRGGGRAPACLAPFRPARLPRHVAILFAIAAATTVPWVLTWPQLADRFAALGVRGFPWGGEAVARAGIAGIGSALVCAAVVASGALVLRLIGWRTTSRVEQVVFAAVTGVVVVVHGSLLLAAAGMYRPIPLAILVAVLLLSGIPEARRIGTTEGRICDVTIVRPLAAGWIALAAVALGYALVAALAPEKEYDALWYHLPLPRVWLEAGRPVDVVEEYVSLYPLAWEQLFAVGMTFGGTVAAKLLHFACLPLLAVLVAQSARRFIPGASPAAAAALLVTTPTLLWESTTAYVDLALALHAAAACYALARYAETRERPWGIVAALQFGLAASTKHLGVPITMIALALFVLAPGRIHAVRAAVKPALLMALLASALPLPWYLRAWHRSGNPVFPEMFSFFGASPPERWDAITERGLAHFKAHFGLGHSPWALLTLPWDATVHGALFGGSLGPLFLVLIPMLIVVRRQVAAVRWLAWGTLAYLAVWASPVSSLQLRFLMPIVPPLALLAAAALDGAEGWAAGATRHGRGLVAAGVMCLAFLNLPPFTPLHDRAGSVGWLTHVLRKSPVAVVMGRESQELYLRRVVPSYAAWQWINTFLPPAVRILAFSSGDQLYAERPRVSYDATVARGAVWGAPGTGANASLEALRRLRITHILFSRRELARLKAEAPAIVSIQVLQACAIEYDDRKYWLCRLDYGAMDRGGP